MTGKRSPSQQTLRADLEAGRRRCADRPCRRGSPGCSGVGEPGEPRDVPREDHADRGLPHQRGGPSARHARSRFRPRSSPARRAARPRITAPVASSNLAQMVDARTWTTGGGNTFPGAEAPFGMVQWSPDTLPNRSAGGGYNFGDKTLDGYSLTHVSGPGCGAAGDVPILPITGDASERRPEQPDDAVHQHRRGGAGRLLLRPEQSALDDHLAVHRDRAQLDGAFHVPVDRAGGFRDQADGQPERRLRRQRPGRRQQRGRAAPSPAATSAASPTTTARASCTPSTSTSPSTTRSRPRT